MTRTHIIIFSGAHPISAMGATQTIDRALINQFSPLVHKVSWIGTGTVECKCNTFTLKTAGTSSRLVTRVWGKLLRICGKDSLPWALFREYVRIDNVAARLIRAGFMSEDEENIFIGRNGMSLEAFKEASRLGAKTVLHSQWMHPFTQRDLLAAEYEGLHLSGAPLLQRRIERQLREIEIVDYIWCISSLVRESFVQNGVPENKLLYVPCGVDCAHFVRQRHAEKFPRFTILFVGNVNPEKGVHLLLRALLLGGFERINVVFNGSLPPYFTSIFDEYRRKLKKMDVQVAVAPGDPRLNYWRSSVLILPSVHESFGLVVLEAMAAGLPVIISDNVGAKDCVVPMENGLIFKSGDIQELREAIWFMLKNPAELERMGARAVEKAQDFDWSIICKRLLYAFSSGNVDYSQRKSKTWKGE